MFSKCKDINITSPNIYNMTSCFPIPYFNVFLMPNSLGAKAPLLHRNNHNLLYCSLNLRGTLVGLYTDMCEYLPKMKNKRSFLSRNVTISKFERYSWIMSLSWMHLKYVQCVPSHIMHFNVPHVKNLDIATFTF